jgi:hypothetical protein
MERQHSALAGWRIPPPIHDEKADNIPHRAYPSHSSWSHPRLSPDVDQSNRAHKLLCVVTTVCVFLTEIIHVLRLSGTPQSKSLSALLFLGDDTPKPSH